MIDDVFVIDAVHVTADLNADSSNVPVRGDTRPPQPATEHITVQLLEVKVRDALNQIIDPCSAAAGAPAGLIDMGLTSAGSLCNPAQTGNWPSRSRFG